MSQTLETLNLNKAIAKQSQLVHNTIVYLFIFFVHLPPDMFRQVTMPLSWGLHQITQDVHEMLIQNVKIFKMLKSTSTDVFQYTPTRHIRPDTWGVPQHKPWNYSIYGRQAEKQHHSSKTSTRIVQQRFYRRF
jgi:hypothetical protein